MSRFAANPAASPQLSPKSLCAAIARLRHLPIWSRMPSFLETPLRADKVAVIAVELRSREC